MAQNVKDLADLAPQTNSEPMWSRWPARIRRGASPQTRLPEIWAAYHNWGDVECSATGQSGVLRLRGASPSPAFIPWVIGMLEQQIVRSGGSSVQDTATESTDLGTPFCTFETEWLLERHSGAYESVVG